eukprot:CAMPEP_0197173830 /NCGR_PEP_ID=MMETSP1423-20130617/609_1 /TAXON_ID=476441 /ORGANISM="Pseudo-nitzschia heimii, Strain UNC1101" /LENGTH=85 /DNA_ID=CAMNT_0042622695 /DNA_START=503 /DNA_END=760 /DNA_ORIENTATION=-
MKQLVKQFLRLLNRFQSVDALMMRRPLCPPPLILMIADQRKDKYFKLACLQYAEEKNTPTGRSALTNAESFNNEHGVGISSLTIQ